MSNEAVATCARPNVTAQYINRRLVRIDCSSSECLAVKHYERTQVELAGFL